MAAAREAGKPVPKPRYRPAIYAREVTQFFDASPAIARVEVPPVNPSDLYVARRRRCIARSTGTRLDVELSHLLLHAGLPAHLNQAEIGCRKRPAIPRLPKPCDPGATSGGGKVVEL